MFVTLPSPRSKKYTLQHSGVNAVIAHISNSSWEVHFLLVSSSYSMKFTFQRHTLLLCFNARMWFSKGSDNVCQFFVFILVDSWICVLTQYLPVFLLFTHTQRLQKKKWFWTQRWGRRGGGGNFCVNSFSEECKKAKCSISTNNSMLFWKCIGSVIQWFVSWLLLLHLN